MSLRKGVQTLNPSGLVRDVKILSINSLKAASGLIAGSMYLFPPITCLASTLSLIYLGIGSRKMISKMGDRLAGIDKILRKRDGGEVKNAVLQGGDLHSEKVPRPVDGRSVGIGQPPIRRL